MTLFKQLQAFISMIHIRFITLFILSTISLFHFTDIQFYLNFSSPSLFLIVSISSNSILFTLIHHITPINYDIAHQFNEIVKHRYDILMFFYINFIALLKSIDIVPINHFIADSVYYNHHFDFISLFNTIV
jgi:hypothetical protein